VLDLQELASKSQPSVSPRPDPLIVHSLLHFGVYSHDSVTPFLPFVFANTPHFCCSPSVHRRRMSQTPFAAPCRTFSHIHTPRVGFLFWDLKRISLPKILVFLLFFLSKILSFRLGYESATLLMAMITDSSRSISCSMHRADMTLPCTAGWLAAAVPNYSALSYPILSSHRHSLPTYLPGSGDVRPAAHIHAAYSTCSCPAPFLHPVPPHSETAVGYEK
jgi:hypothetical protein